MPVWGPPRGLLPNPPAEVENLRFPDLIRRTFSMKGHQPLTHISPVAAPSYNLNDALSGPDRLPRGERMFGDVLNVDPQSINKRQLWVITNITGSGVILTLTNARVIGTMAVATADVVAVSIITLQQISLGPGTVFINNNLDSRSSTTAHRTVTFADGTQGTTWSGAVPASLLVQRLFNFGAAVVTPIDSGELLSDEAQLVLMPGTQVVFQVNFKLAATTFANIAGQSLTLSLLGFERNFEQSENFREPGSLP